jgi:multimeric flavodoxin WrbA
MKITVLMGSPNRKGSTSILVEQFKKGAEQAGHLYRQHRSVYRL